MRALLAVIAGVLLIAIAGVVAYANGAIRLTNPDRVRFVVRGVDVSRHQGKIDWRQVAADDVGFAYIKASEGGDLKDPLFAANVAAARAAGLPVGAYHFFTLCRSGADQAANVLATLSDRRLDLPLAVDLEYVGNCSRRPSREAFAAELRVFVAEVEGATGRRPIFYVTPKFHRDYLAGAGFNSHALWVRDVAFGLGGPKPALLWQYADNARVRGIAGPVDLDVFDGSRSAFGAWTRGDH